MTHLANPDCTLCALHKTCKIVCIPGQGKARKRVMIIADKPGAMDELDEYPLSGKDGEFLFAELHRIGLAPDDVYLTYAVKCRPPEDRNPRKSERVACSKYLAAEIAQYMPEFIITLGANPLEQLTLVKGMKNRRGRCLEWTVIAGIKVWLFPLFAPGYAAYEPSAAITFRTDITRLGECLKAGGPPQETELRPRLILTVQDKKDFLRDLRGTVSYDLETNTLYPWAKDAAIIAAGFGTLGNQWVLPSRHVGGPWSDEQFTDIILDAKERLRDCITVMHNGKFDAVFTYVHCGVWLHCDFDTMLAHYILDENMRHDLKLLSKYFLGAVDYDVDLETKQGKKGLEPLAVYLAHDIYYTRELKPVLQRLLNKDGAVKRVFDKILMPCSRLYAEMMVDGVYIDLAKMAEAEKELQRMKAEAKAKLDKRMPGVNWASPDQVAKAFFGTLRQKSVTKTKGGKESTGKNVLKRLEHPAAKELLDFREADKMLSAFFKGWKPFLVGDYLHPSVKIHGTVTGRPSYAEPNLQQVPRNKLVRQLISAPPGWTLVEIDLSQIELRITAELAGCPTMLDTFLRGLDIHWKTGIEVLSSGGGDPERFKATAYKITGRHVKYNEAVEIVLESGPSVCEKLDEEWKNIRYKAKAINFGFVFGMWWKSFKEYARNTYGVKIEDREAKEAREAFFALYALEDWHKRQKAYARFNGYVRSLFGRKRRLPEAEGSPDAHGYGHALRQAINSPVQSCASDINLSVALQLRREFPRSKVRLCATIHDAILARVRNDTVAAYCKRALRIMQRPAMFEEFDISLTVPICGEAKVGAWGVGKDFHV